MHKSRFFSGIALLALSASGCALAAASPEPDVVVPAEPTAIDFVDPATVIGLSTRTVTEGDSPGSGYVHIDYPEFAGATALNRELRAQAERQLGDFRARNRGVEPVSPRPELNVDWQLAAASPEAVAVRLRTGEFQGERWANSTRTFWFDPRTRQATGSTGLLDEHAALVRLAELVGERLKERGNQVERDAVTAGGDDFDSMAFNRHGDLVVEFDDCQVGPCSLGRVAVAVPAGQVTPLLSKLGRQAQESARQARGGSVDSPDFAPANSPDAVSNRAGSVDCARVKCVALTFDDGPGPYTGRLLDLLKQERARATFFTVGSNAMAQPALLRRMSVEGHLVGNHTWAHRDLSKQGSSKITETIAKTGDAVSAIIGQTPKLVRPPYGAVSQQVCNVAREMGLSLVTWSVDAKDQDGDKAKDITDRTVREAHPGAIILMHDIHRETVDAVPDILKQLRGKGYTFVTVPELYGSAGMQAGRLYRSGNELPGKQPLT
ncbi:peptidoglycan/xylan/chitin deacetylase (PgdA/CDA1 family) [Nonomuraea thailandensis]|uniref:Peptidoglycan/xylan/chitin deacetylase (PgdA/CDA1 family) n=1 Tax=Nonomuraea thailandensis TaxID=1188745 RepID=A0A9X2K7J9_9ACTN|nr:polysaccharide deacetylase family protein [Nonomuraea thailandensis]MCP2362665.1 peptidoglycan/xylan/chitin deacetylase (PgdA/CDA1 family) [Nonomuraea thailandensis]